jgi:ribosomal-protein-alanine N-acetyltransferase
MFRRRINISLETARMTLRLPQASDQNAWIDLRNQNAEFLQPWEPIWHDDHLTRRSFSQRIYWSQKSAIAGSAYPLFLTRREDDMLLGAVTLDNVRRGPAQTGTLGYWIGQKFARQGYMQEAIQAVVHHAFSRFDLSRIEAACLPENQASRGVLEKSGFKYEGVAQSYLQIAGRWRNHVLYANLRSDRRGKSDAT